MILLHMLFFSLSVLVFQLHTSTLNSVLHVARAHSEGRGEEGFAKDLIGQYSIGNENEQMDCCHCLKGCCAPALQIDPLAQISVGPPDYQSGFGTNKITGIKKKSASTCSAGRLLTGRFVVQTQFTPVCMPYMLGQDTHPMLPFIDQIIYKIRLTHLDTI